MQTVNILIIEDQDREAKTAYRAISEFFNESETIEINIVTENDFEKGLELTRNGDFHAVVLDVNQAKTQTTPERPTAGRTTFDEIKISKFVPIVFWTAYPEVVQEYESRPYVQVLSKDEFDSLPTALETAINNPSTKMVQHIQNDVNHILRDYMWNEIAKYQQEYSNDGDSLDIGQLLLIRLHHLLTKKIDFVSPHSAYRYIFPELSSRRAPGDILFDTVNSQWFVLLTPACDLIERRVNDSDVKKPKVDFVLVAKANPLEDHHLFKEWYENKSNNRRSKLERNVLKSTHGRYYYLPKFRSIPDLVVDLEALITLQYNDIKDSESIEVKATLSSPFAESLVIQFSHFIGRIGTPDLNIEAIFKRLVE